MRFSSELQTSSTSMGFYAHGGQTVKLQMSTRNQQDEIWPLIVLIVAIFVFLIIAIFASSIEQLLLTFGVPPALAGAIRLFVFSGIIILGIWKIFKLLL